MKYELTRTFYTNLTLNQMLALLHVELPWRWQYFDNDTWGYYLSAAVWSDPDYVYARLFYDPENLDRMVAQVHLTSERDDAEARFAAVCDLLLSRVLPLIGAREIAEAEGDYEKLQEPIH